MCDCLYVGGNEVVIFVREVNVAGVKALEYAFYDLDAFVWRTVLDDNLESRGKSWEGSRHGGHVQRAVLQGTR